MVSGRGIGVRAARPPLRAGAWIRILALAAVAGVTLPAGDWPLFLGRSDRNAIAAAPLDRILVETDSPYLAPPPHRGKRCEPAYVAHTTAKGAEIMGISLEDFCAATTANFDRLFAQTR